MEVLGFQGLLSGYKQIGKESEASGNRSKDLVKARSLCCHRASPPATWSLSVAGATTSLAAGKQCGNTKHKRKCLKDICRLPGFMPRHLRAEA